LQSGVNIILRRRVVTICVLIVISLAAILVSVFDVLASVVLEAWILFAVLFAEFLNVKRIDDGNNTLVHAKSRTLSSRENKVLSRLADGLSNQAIANDLFWPEKRVQAYVEGLCTKLGAPTRNDLVKLAYQKGLLKKANDWLASTASV
jgi:DNA-binding CsgD family transcriptional regulator